MKDPVAILGVHAIQLGAERKFLFTAPLFIDCSGYGVLGYRAGARFRWGMEARSEFGESQAPPEPSAAASTVSSPSPLAASASNSTPPMARRRPAPTKSASTAPPPDLGPHSWHHHFRSTLPASEKFMSHSLSRSLLIAAAISLLPAAAQYRAGLQGVVTDPQNAPIPGAAVTLTAKETNTVRTASTNESGAYTISALLPGAYSLAVEKAGFTRKLFEEVIVTADQVQSFSVQLAVGQVSESVTVNETSAPLLDTQGATIAGTITAREVENLPSFARDPFQLARLTPGVFGNGAIANGGGTTSMPGVNRPAAGAANSIFFLENGPQIIANGARQNSNNIQVDGVGVNSVSWGGSAVVTPNEESIKEIRVVANNYSAENGHQPERHQRPPRQRLLQVAPPWPQRLPALERPRQPHARTPRSEPLQPVRRQPRRTYRQKQTLRLLLL
jgi:hypothetical protein